MYESIYKWQYCTVGIKELEENNISITQWKENRQITAEELIEACQDQDGIDQCWPE